ncbi:GAF and ANTAR domain-containing protein [Cellulomonas sp. 179-A 4D5 NHS]|uniref:GAF and ANTAR domain-containing protein n=1 Tax=Cellulomonas sp. 179-A 4D5 NHS TaxID=3142378 RepID=UPI00399F0CE7
MEPIPQTSEVLRELRTTGGPDLEAMLRDMAERVSRVVPSCTGMSLSVADAGLTFTLVSTSEQTSALDGVQYATSGPCVQTALEGIELTVQDVLNEDRWQRFAAAAAAENVRSSLSLPLLVGGWHGSINLYAADPRAFTGDLEELRAIVGPGIDVAVTNADLPFRTRTYATDAPRSLGDLDLIEQAVGMLMAQEGLDPDRARQHLQDAAERAGIDQLTLARTLISAL